MSRVYLKRTGGDHLDTCVWGVSRIGALAARVVARVALLADCAAVIPDGRSRRSTRPKTEDDL